MPKLIIFLLIAVSLFGSNIEAHKTQFKLNNLSATPTPKPKSSPEIQSVALSREEVIIPCLPLKSDIIREGLLCNDEMFVNIETTANNPKNVELTYLYTVSGGRIVGKGESVVWDLTGVREGYYMITIGIGDDRTIFDSTVTKTVKVQDCECCFPKCTCPSLSVSGGGSIKAGETINFEANVSGIDVKDITYNWTVSQGEIIEGQGTPQIKVKTNSDTVGKLTATVEIGNTEFCYSCLLTASETATIFK